MSVTIELNSNTAATRRRPMPSRDQPNIRQKPDPRNEDAVGDSIRLKSAFAAGGAMTRLRPRSLSPLSMYHSHCGTSCSGPRGHDRSNSYRSAYAPDLKTLSSDLSASL